MSITKTSSDHRPGEALAGRWQLDQRRSRVEFRARHFWGLATVKGHFEEYQGRLDLNAAPSIELTIDAASVQSGNRKRDEHLRSSDFFDAEEHPVVRFISDSVVPGDDMLKVRGRLFAREQSIPLELDARVRLVDGELKIKAAATATHRKLGMIWSPLGVIPPRSELLVEGYLVPAA
jgi:polyisoprenoid-binding protein YceI